MTRLPRKVLLCAVVTTTLVLVGASDAKAWGSWGSSHGSSGGYSSGSWGGYASHGSWGGSSGSWGGHRHHVGLFRRISRRLHHSHGSWGSSGSWGGSYGSHGSRGGSYSYSAYSCGSYGGSYSSSYGGSYGGSSYGGSYGGTVVAPGYGATPAVIYESESGDPNSLPSSEAPSAGEEGASNTDGNTTRLYRDSATLSVSVPVDARVFVNDSPTTSTGTLRRFVSRGLQPGASYSYRVRVEFERDGELVSELKTVRLTAGGVAALAFDAAAEPAPVAAKPVETKLTLHVPADAKVILAGHTTRQSGQTRQFITTHLESGQVWEDYTVRVEVEQAGSKLVEQRTLKLVGGETRELTIDLDAPKVASK